MNGLQRFYLFIVAAALFLSCQTARAQMSADLLFEEANIAFSRGAYENAIEKYRQILSQYGQSGSVLFNLGNSYALTGKTGLAILNYERAQRISPSNSDIAGNLALIKKESGLFAQETTGVEKFLTTFSLNQWTIVFLVSLLAIAVIQLISLLRPLSVRSIASSTAVCSLLLLLSLLGGYTHYPDFNPSIVISSEARLLISPFEEANSVGSLQEGRRVYPLKSHKGYTYVVDETERKGWVADTQIEAVSPATTK